MLSIKREQYEQIVKYAMECLPNEACGLIGGTLEQDTKWVREVYLLKNIDESREHFSMDPKEQLSVVKELRKKGYVLLGNFHSHPETPARPSDEDKRLAYDPEASYLILSLQNSSRPVLKSFAIRKGEASEEEICIV